jgi:DNA repair photolyase
MLNIYEYRAQVEFRFTFTSMNEERIKFYEPRAPTFEDRFKVLKYAKFQHFKTSISLEPYLDDNEELIQMISLLNGQTNGDIWLGVMSNIPRSKIKQEEYQRLRKNYSQDNLLELTKRLYNFPQVRFKDSISKVLGISRPCEFNQISKNEDIRKWLK